MDLVAILVLIIIACSGFFVAFTLSFSVHLNAAGAAYALFQMLMGNFALWFYKACAN